MNLCGVSLKRAITKSKFSKLTVLQDHPKYYTSSCFLEQALPSTKTTIQAVASQILLSFRCIYTKLQTCPLIALPYLVQLEHTHVISSCIMIRIFSQCSNLCLSTQLRLAEHLRGCQRVSWWPFLQHMQTQESQLVVSEILDPGSWSLIINIRLYIGWGTNKNII